MSDQVALIHIPHEQVPATSRAPWEAAREQLVSEFLRGRSPRTHEAYTRDLADFARFVGRPTLAAAAELLIAGGHGPANVMARAYRNALLERALSPATVNRRLAALRSLVQLARTAGEIGWQLEVKGVDSQSYRDTAGPGRTGFVQVLEAIDGASAKACRDRAVIRLLFDRGLRRGEVASLDLEHLDLEAGTISIMGKGRRERESLSLPPVTVAALRAWLDVRGTEPGPLFINFDRAGKGKEAGKEDEAARLTGRSIARLVAAAGDRAGIHVRPHGLRHAAITEALDRTKGDVRAVQRFSRHRDLRVLTRYDDNREDLGGDVARLITLGT